MYDKRHIKVIRINIIFLLYTLWYKNLSRQGNVYPEDHRLNVDSIVVDLFSWTSNGLKENDTYDGDRALPFRLFTDYSM